MLRTLVAVSLVLIPGWAFAAKNEAQIKSLKGQIEKARHDEAAALKQIDEQTKSAVKAMEKPEEHEKKERARLEHEEKEALKHIDERFEHTLKNLTPKEVHHQMEEALQTLKHIRLSLTKHGWDDLNYHDDRALAGKSLHAAEDQLSRAVGHDTWEERKKAGEAIHAAHTDVVKALHSHPIVNGSERGTAQGAAEIAETNKLLIEDLQKLDHAHHLLTAVDHEIKDLEHEKKELLKKKEEEKKKKKEEFHHKAEKLTKEIHDQQEQAKKLEHDKESKKKQAKEKFANQIKQLEAQLNQLEKAK